MGRTRRHPERLDIAQTLDLLIYASKLVRLGVDLFNVGDLLPQPLNSYGVCLTRTAHPLKTLLKIAVLAKKLGISVLGARDFFSAELIQSLALPRARSKP